MSLCRAPIEQSPSSGQNTWGCLKCPSRSVLQLVFKSLPYPPGGTSQLNPPGVNARRKKVDVAQTSEVPGEGHWMRSRGFLLGRLPPCRPHLGRGDPLTGPLAGAHARHPHRRPTGGPGFIGAGDCLHFRSFVLLAVAIKVFPPPVLWSE